MTRSIALVTGLTLVIVACQDTDTPVGPGTEAGALAAGATVAGRQYGSPVKVGNGSARTYVIFDKTSGAPVELGVALSEKAMDGLPAPMGGPMEGHEDMHEYILPLPKKGPANFQFVELDWNPAGHSAPYYNQPHFDFHFHKFSLAERNAIDPSDPLYAERAANFPEPNYIPAGWYSPSTLLGIPPVAVAVPHMGIHWIDPTSPEYPPQSRIFTHTFIVGTWDGRVTFYEPMVTREFMMNQRVGLESKVDKAIPVAQRHSPAGYYPDSYRVLWDGDTREYRVALTGLAFHQ